MIRLWRRGKQYLRLHDAQPAAEQEVIDHAHVFVSLGVAGFGMFEVEPGFYPGIAKARLIQASERG